MNVYPENTNLIDVITSLPGINNVSSNLSFFGESDTLNIFFHVSKNCDKGLFLLTRCCDKRYFQYGHNWKIELSVADQYKNNTLPICYMLSSYKVTGKNAEKQAKALVDNINYHLNHSLFLSGYELDREEFRKNFISYQRKKKLNNININM
jgi:hypothetical protein